METQIINPDVSNFIKSLRDVGYTFEIAVADILDNSITAGADSIKIYTVAEPEKIFSMLDNGIGMSNEELIEAMRLAAKDPESKREKNDLGRFGLGLKMASFSQCKRLTVLSKRDGIISIKQWDLNYIIDNNSWILITPDVESIKKFPLLEQLKKQDHGTLVIWQKIDRYDRNGFTDVIDKLRKHLSLVFHRYLEGINRAGLRKINIDINNNPLKAFDPFNSRNPATQQLAEEKIRINGSSIFVQPFILPHHSKVSQQEYEKYATEDGYTKTQGFYLYRANRLLIYGTWWRLHKSIDAHKLVRIKIDIDNGQDCYWGIDIKKSSANPVPEIKKELKRIIGQVTERGSRVYTGRGRKIKDKSIKRFWEIKPFDNGFRFALNENHPILKKIREQLESKELELIDTYLKGVQAYLPLEAIQAQLQQNPHKIKQETALTEQEIVELVEKLKASNLDESYINDLLKTELFKNYKGLFQNE